MGQAVKIYLLWHDFVLENKTSENKEQSVFRYIDRYCILYENILFGVD